MSEPDREPFNEQGFLSLLDFMEIRNPNYPDATDWTRLIHEARKLVTENIRLRNAERLARHRLALLEQGQTLLPLPPTTLTNQPAAPLP